MYGGGEVWVNHAWDELFAYCWFKLCSLEAWGATFAGMGVEYDASAGG